ALAGRVVAAPADPFAVGNGLQLPLSASVGVSVTGDPNARPADLLRDADTAMYRVKQHGRNGFHVFDAAADGENDDHLQLAAELQDRKSTRLNSSHVKTSYAVFCLKKKRTRSQ